MGVVFIAILGGLLFGYDTAVISGAEQALQKHLGLDAFWHGVMPTYNFQQHWQNCPHQNNSRPYNGEFQPLFYRYNTAYFELFSF